MALNKCLGRKPAVIDPRVKELTAIVPSILHYNPAQYLLRGSEIPSWLMGGNDTCGDCSSVGIANILLARSTWAGHTQTPTLQDILSFYERFGFVPTEPLTDKGATLQECMQSWMTKGYPVRGSTNKLQGYASINFKNLNLLKSAIEIFGDVYAGVNLTVAQQTQDVWKYVPGDQEWGGHCVPINGWDEHGNFKIVTWADWKTVEPSFILNQMEEAFVLLDAASIKKGLMTFDDWGMEALEDVIKSLGGRLAV